ncbi:hypothetical protein GF369_02855 [Candidatus Peregrinibacteria bacterium]|nr:hypothetical protein [Candidatus Peregrinibacteria bacterium]
MNKLTIFFIGATVLVIGIVGTLLGYKYFERHDETTPKEVQEVSPHIDETTETLLENQPIVSEKPESNDDITAPEDNQPGETDSPLITVLAGIDELLVQEAGFEDPDVSIEQFDGLIFDDYDISEFQDDEHIRYIITEYNEQAGIINELIYPSSEVAKGVYAQLKTKMSDKESPYTVNETNQYGTASFFANHQEETNSVFLVVKFTDRLYTLHYPAKNHNKMKNILETI